VLHITFRKRHYFDTVFSDLVKELKDRSKFLEAASPEDLVTIVKTEKPTALLLTDETILDDKFQGIRAKFVEFAKSGGTVLFCCWFAGAASTESMDNMWRLEWDLPWKKLFFREIRFSLNPYRWTKSHAVEGLPDKYTIKGWYLGRAVKEDAVYVTTPERRADRGYWVHDHGRSPVLLTPYGLGWVGYVGDDYNRPGTTQVIVALCGLRG
jgi:hypothetical protein